SPRSRRPTYCAKSWAISAFRPTRPRLCRPAPLPRCPIASPTPRPDTPPPRGPGRGVPGPPRVCPPRIGGSGEERRDREERSGRVRRRGGGLIGRVTSTLAPNEGYARLYEQGRGRPRGSAPLGSSVRCWIGCDCPPLGALLAAIRLRLLTLSARRAVNAWFGRTVAGAFAKERAALRGRFRLEACTGVGCAGEGSRGS